MEAEVFPRRGLGTEQCDISRVTRTEKTSAATDLSKVIRLSWIFPTEGLGTLILAGRDPWGLQEECG
jgi:hypothetical protein